MSDTTLTARESEEAIAAEWEAINALERGEACCDLCEAFVSLADLDEGVCPSCADAE